MSYWKVIKQIPPSLIKVNVTRSNFLNFAKTEPFNVAKIECSNVAKTESLMSQKVTFLILQKLNFLMSQKLISLMSQKVTFLMSRKLNFLTSQKEVRNSRITKFSYEIKLRKRTSNFELLLRKFLQKFFFPVTNLTL